MTRLIQRTLMLMTAMLITFSAQAQQLVLGIIPAENNEAAVARFEPVRKDMEEQLGRSVRVFQATDYTGIVEAMRRGRVDIAWFGPASGMMAHQQAGAIPFAVGVSAGTGSATYHTHFMVRADSDYHTLADLEGRDFALVDPASASGGLVPTYMVHTEFQKTSEEFFGRVIFAGTHDSSVMALVNGSVEGAAVGDFLFENMIARGHVNREDFRVIATSDPVPNPPMMIRKELGEELRQQVIEIFTTLHERHDNVIGMGDYSHYQEATMSDYQLILDMMELGLM